MRCVYAFVLSLSLLMFKSFEHCVDACWSKPAELFTAQRSTMAVVAARRILGRAAIERARLSIDRLFLPY